MLEYFRIYVLNFSQQERSMTDTIYAGEYDPNLQTTHNMNVRASVRLDGRLYRVYKYVRDSKNYIFRARTKIPLARYYNRNPQHGEAFYYQLIILNYPCRNFEDERRDSWRDWFHELVDGNDSFKNRFTADFLADITAQEIIIDRQERQTNPVQNEVMLEGYLATATDDQIFAYDTILNNPHGRFLIHGGAGVGKSRLLRMFYLGLVQSGFVPVKLSPTGVAANTIDGQTIHRFLGITNRPNVPNLMRVDQYFKDLQEGQRLALLIDEVSMVSSELLTVLDEVLQRTTLTNLPFGNVLIIFFRDFGQLIPVDEDINPTGTLPLVHPIFDNALIHPLTTNVRVEQEEIIFKTFLNKVRRCDYDEFFFNIVKERTIAIPDNTLRVYVSNAEKDQYNDTCFELTNGRTFYYSAIDNSIEIRSSTAVNETGLIANLRFKTGVPVMLLHNISVKDGCINGTMATVMNLRRDSVDIMKENGDRLLVHRITRTIYKSSISCTQIPLVLAYACTVHKVQSLTLPAVAVCLYNDFFSHGQFYVAVSRVTKMSNLYFFPNVEHTSLNIRQELDCLQAIVNIEDPI